ncbi:MAG: histidine phosphatase family protein [Candidatus Micrarchaeota archaeon]
MAEAAQVKLYVVRHGQTWANRDGIFPGAGSRLTRDGLEQAWLVWNKFRKMNVLIDTVIVTPTLRARETAEPTIAGQVKKPRIIIVPGLAEKDPGRAAGMRIPNGFEEIDRACVKRGGESWGQFIERVAGTACRLLGDIEEGKLGANVAIFSHSLSNRILLGVIEGRRALECLRGKGQENGGVRTIEFQRR